MLNQGISFGLLQGIPVWVVGLVWICLFIYAVKMRELWGRVGVGLMLLGGAGNMVSRVWYGGVVDNLNFFGLFYNNVWDYLIFIGVGVYIWQNVFLSHD
jgi:signal peptidase II